MSRPWLGWLGLAAATVVLVVGLRWFFRSDMQRISDAVDSAREALVERDEAVFLMFFTPDVTYQGGGDLDTLKKDLRRWNQVGLQQVHILEETIEVDSAAGTADVELSVLVGHELFRMGSVRVQIDVVKDAEGEWRVRAFSWERT